MTDKLEGIKEGDTVEVTFRGVVDNLGPGGVVMVPHTVGAGCGVSFYPDETASPHFTIKKIDPPLKVGDRVRRRFDPKAPEWEVVTPAKTLLLGRRTIVVWCGEGIGYVETDPELLERI